MGENQRLGWGEQNAGMNEKRDVSGVSKRKVIAAEQQQDLLQKKVET